MISFAGCKINIGLYITEKRPDGFHNLESIFYPVPFQDVLEIIPAKEFSFQADGIIATDNAEDNLCVKAYRLLQEKYDLPPVSIFLLKTIPTGAGLGGGSSDAATVLKMLNELFSLGIPDSELEELSARLGSDCPFFIKNQPAYVTGRGEFLELVPLSLKGYWITIIHPKVHISTGEAFSNIQPKPAPVTLKEIIRQPVSGWKGIITNDFEPYAFATYPELRQIRDFLYEKGARYASMSGSGSSIFGISEKEVETSPFRNEYLVFQKKLAL